MAIPFETLYRDHVDFVWRTLRRLGVPKDALEDAGQEVFLVVHRRLGEFRPGSSPRSWLFAIVQRVASNQRRWLQRKGSGLVPLPDTMTARSESPLDETIRRQASDIVLEFLASLDEPRRIAFVLADLEQMGAPEIAQAVGANVNTVYYRIASARRAFSLFVRDKHGNAHKGRKSGE